MHKVIKTGVACATLAVALGSAAPAFAAPGDNGNGVGGCISGDLYGNTSNPRPSGHGVLPSQSPGPSVNNPTDPSNPTPGPSVGDVNQAIHASDAAAAAGIHSTSQLCRALPGIFDTP